MADFLQQARNSVVGPRGAFEQAGNNLSKVIQLIEDGELSRTAKTLQSAGVAQGNTDTLAQLTDPEKRPPDLLAPLPANVVDY